MHPFWLSAFLDLGPDEHERATTFWLAVTGCTLSPARGDLGEFTTLVPGHGDDHLRVQRLSGGPSRVHLDLHVDGVPAWAERAVSLGARLVAQPGHAVLTSPGGLPFCLVGHEASVRTRPQDWGGHTSLVDQVCLDIPPSRYDAEVDFWRTLTGWPFRDSPSPEFARLLTPDELPLRILLQRLDAEPGGPGDGGAAVSAHLDLAASDRTAEIERHRGLGAQVVREGRGWTVMQPPAGPVYCITDRHPG